MNYLNGVLDSISTSEMWQKMLEEIKEIWTGPEGLFSELKDAVAAISALAHITTFNNPRLFRIARTIAETPKPPII